MFYTVLSQNAKIHTFCRKMLKYDTFCCANLDSTLFHLDIIFDKKKDIIRQKIDINV